jgi:hypothetical protein
MQQLRTFARNAGIPDGCVFPVEETVLCAWLVTMHGVNAGSTAENALAGVRAEHILAGLPFPDSERVVRILKSIERGRPKSSRRPRRPHVTLDMLRCLVDSLPNPSPFHAAVIACALAAFWGQFRLGKLLPTLQQVFNPRYYPTRAAWSASQNGSIVIPWTKTNPDGATIRLPPQLSRTCAVMAMTRYTRSHPAPADAPLFSYKNPRGERVALTKRAFLNAVVPIWTRHDFPRISGHAFRIGGTTELLRRGVAPDVVKVSGRWASDSFLKYWRLEDEIIPQHLDNIVVSKRPRAAPRG